MQYIMNTKSVQFGDQVWSLPEVLTFQGYELRPIKHFYDVVAFRKPMKGEYFISGAIPMAYKAANDLPTEYLIAVPTKQARQVVTWS